MCREPHRMPTVKFYIPKCQYRTFAVRYRSKAKRCGCRTMASPTLSHLRVSAFPPFLSTFPCVPSPLFSLRNLGKCLFFGVCNGFCPYFWKLMKNTNFVYKKTYIPLLLLFFFFSFLLLFPSLPLSASFFFFVFLMLANCTVCTKPNVVGDQYHIL